MTALSQGEDLVGREALTFSWSLQLDLGIGMNWGKFAFSRLLLGRATCEFGIELRSPFWEHWLVLLAICPPTILKFPLFGGLASRTRSRDL
jgi:hypothetical protein